MPVDERHSTDKIAEWWKDSRLPDSKSIELYVGTKKGKKFRSLLFSTYYKQENLCNIWGFIPSEDELASLHKLGESLREQSGQVEIVIEVDETTPQGLRRLEQFKTFAVECNTLLACVESISYCYPRDSF